jgi:MFS family permease
MPMEARSTQKNPRPRIALALLLAINLFNFLDRQVLAAVLPQVRTEFFGADQAAAGAKAGLLATAFLATYMLMAPILGWLADRYSRWIIVGVSVALWSLASGWSGTAASFGSLLLSRMWVGIGEAGYGPAAPALIADLYPVESRGRALSWFFLAVPVGSALGYVAGGLAASHLGWRWAFYLVVPPGLLLAALCCFFQDPRPARPARPSTPKPSTEWRANLRKLIAIRSYRFNCGAMTAMTFAIGGIAFWMPDYIFRTRTSEFAQSPHLLATINTVFGGITVLAGLLGTLTGGWLADRLRPRFPQSYFLVSGVGILLAFPPLAAMLWVPFPYAWGLIFCSVFFLFFNTGPSNTALANVAPPAIRSLAFALNIFVIHALGDAISPPLIGWIGGRWGMNTAFLLVGAVMVLAGVFWLGGARHLPKDSADAQAAPQLPSALRDH